ncbi:hypothetical protein PT974_02630 [Cladobotryum mycophilum]|uniref:Uncharacterized protein n=1 Tax=Cladobotryum mycophilum TaxID=491253 RepID=A0ABR0SZU7_9HYPO
MSLVAFPFQPHARGLQERSKSDDGRSDSPTLDTRKPRFSGSPDVSAMSSLGTTQKINSFWRFARDEDVV